ncbi:MAG: DUF4294 domain-containing protein [Flavobacteriales bacterium]|nr:DUF4294 domain-containing protein [Flavobacteriales bacterium]
MIQTLAGQEEKEQSLDDGAVVAEVKIENGDTIHMIYLDDVIISTRRKAKSKKYQRKYGRIKNKVLKVYPYAEITKSLIEDYDRELETYSSEHDRKQFLKNAEDELKAEFEGEIRNLRVSEGKILIKLIDRETGKTSYELIKQLRGGFTAFMWQGVAKLFGSDLKSEYDAHGDDEIIEEIILAIEKGELSPRAREPITAKAQERLRKKREKRAKQTARKEAKDKL